MSTGFPRLWYLIQERTGGLFWAVGPDRWWENGHQTCFKALLLFSQSDDLELLHVRFRKRGLPTSRTPLTADPQTPICIKEGEARAELPHSEWLAVRAVSSLESWSSMLHSHNDRHHISGAWKNTRSVSVARCLLTPLYLYIFHTFFFYPPNKDRQRQKMGKLAFRTNRQTMRLFFSLLETLQSTKK